MRPLLLSACDDSNCLACPGDATVCGTCADGYFVDVSDGCTGNLHKISIYHHLIYSEYCEFHLY